MSFQTDVPGGDVAASLYRIVRQNPGIHFRGLKRAANVSSNGQLRYHIDRLENGDALVEVEDGGYTRFFVPGEYAPELRDAIARLARRVPRTIGKLLLEGPMRRTELRDALGCADSTLGYHLNRMIQQGDVERDRRRHQSLYALTDPDLVRRVLDAIGETPVYRANGQDGNDTAPLQAVQGSPREGDACPAP